MTGDRSHAARIGSGRRQRCRSHGEHERADRNRQRRPRPHVGECVQQPPLQAAVRRRGGFPFQQLAPRPEQSHERAADRVEQKLAAIGEERNIEDKLAEQRTDAQAPSRRESTETRRECCRRCYPGATERTGPPVSPGQPPSRARASRAGSSSPVSRAARARRHEAAAEVVQKLPALQKRQRVSSPTLGSSAPAGPARARAASRRAPSDARAGHRRDTAPGNRRTARCR